jgi:hypothetical protein
MSMRLCRLVAAAALAVFAQNQAPQPGANDPRFQEIRAKHQRGETITEQERDYVETVVERTNQTNTAIRMAAYAKEHPPRESTGLAPLPDLGTGKYQGMEGGLYPGGRNTPPKAHLDAGLRLSRSIVPLDASGKPSPDGKVVFVSIGMSNTTQETRSFLKLATGDASLNLKLALVDCAQGGQTASAIADPNANYWKLVASRLKDAGVTHDQVQALWFKEANAAPKEAFPVEAKKLEQDIVKDLQLLHGKFPNLKIAYLSNRTYAGYAGSMLNPEPHAYETGFAVKWAIERQIQGDPELNYDPARGAVRAPWVQWGPYLWADGLKGRKDGQVIWKREDFGPDGTHPSLLGREKVARLLMAFLKSDPTSKPWLTAK